MSKVYIYPKGVTGEQLGWCMEYVDGVHPEYIDDDIKGRNFNDLKERIALEKGIIYIALSRLSPKYKLNLETIVEKIKREKIDYILGGMEEYAQKAIYKLGNECARKGWNAICALILPDFVKDKHFGFLEEELKKRRVKVLLFCSQRGSYERALDRLDEENQCLLYLSYEFLPLLDFPKVICVTGTYQYHKNVKVIYVGHGIIDWNVNGRIQAVLGNDVCVVGREFMPKKADSITRFLPIGYLGYDKIAKDFSSTKMLVKESVLFAPYDLGELERMIPSIKEVLERFSVILRYRYEWEDSHLQYLEQFLDHQKFTIDNSNPMSLESYQKSFCLVCSKTTSKFSFPLVTLCPSVVVEHNQEGYDQDIGELGVNISLIGGGGAFSYC